ncbi:MAG: hypothetical protein LBP38_04400 [Desulfovibrio sp.]|nr:hypothetical protein [Desulfovibrio sp.]
MTDAGAGHTFAENLLLMKGSTDTKLHSNEFECKTSKFLKNRQSLIFQKLAGGGFASAVLTSKLFSVGSSIKKRGFQLSHAASRRIGRPADVYRFPRKSVNALRHLPGCAGSKMRPL